MAICNTGSGTLTSRTKAPESATKASTTRMKTATCMAQFRILSNHAQLRPPRPVGVKAVSRKVESKKGRLIGGLFTNNIRYL